MTFQAILIIIGIVLAVGGVSYFVGKWRAKKLIEGGKIIGDSEGNDSNRDDAVTTADNQVKKNEDVIKESEEAIARAQNVLAEAREKVRKLREKDTSDTSADSSSG